MPDIEEVGQHERAHDHTGDDDGEDDSSTITFRFRADHGHAHPPLPARGGRLRGARSSQGRSKDRRNQSSSRQRRPRSRGNRRNRRPRRTLASASAHIASTARRTASTVDAMARQPKDWIERLERRHEDEDDHPERGDDRAAGTNYSSVDLTSNGARKPAMRQCACNRHGCAMHLSKKLANARTRHRRTGTLTAVGALHSKRRNRPEIRAVQQNEHESADTRPEVAMPRPRWASGPAYGGRKHVSRTEIRSGVNALPAEAAVRRRHTLLVVYRGASDVAAKGATFLITVVAARQLTRDDFGMFALASTLGWLGAAAADFGIQVHPARAVSQHPESGRTCSGDGCRCELPQGSRR